MNNATKRVLKLAAAAACLVLLIAAVPNEKSAPPTSMQPQSEGKPQTADDMRAWLKQEMFKKGPAANPYVLLCMRSAWDHWYSSWLWSLWALLTGAPDPHPPIWKWVQNTPDNWNMRLPDFACADSPRPPEPTVDNTATPVNSPVKLN